MNDLDDVKPTKQGRCVQYGYLGIDRVELLQSALESDSHKWFDQKRKKGEWFALNAEDVAVFRRSSCRYVRSPLPRHRPHHLLLRAFSTSPRQRFAWPISWLETRLRLDDAAVPVDSALRQRLLQLLDHRGSALRLSQVELPQVLTVLEMCQADITHIRAGQEEDHQALAALKLGQARISDL